MAVLDPEAPIAPTPLRPDVADLARIGVGAGAKLSAEVAGRALQFALAFAAQLALGPAEYGHVTYALALGAVLAPVSDLGLQLTATREIAASPSRASTLAAEAWRIKWQLSLVAAVLTLLAIRWREPALRSATAGIALSVIASSIVEFFGYLLRGVGRVTDDAVLVLSARGIVVASGLAALAMGAGIDGLAVAYAVGASCAALVSVLRIRRVFGPARVEPRWDLLRASAPLGIAMILSMLHARLAVFLLDAYTTPADVGIYGVAHKLTEPLAIVPAAIMAAVFPAISSGAGRVPGRLRTLTIAVLAGAGALVAFAGYFAAPFVVQLLYADQYAESAAPLRILVVTVLFTFVNYALTHFLVAERRVHVSVLFTAVTLAVNGAACALLIPLYGPTGAAMSLLASEAVLFALCAAALGRSWRSG